MAATWDTVSLTAAIHAWHVEAQRRLGFCWRPPKRVPDRGGWEPPDDECFGFAFPSRHRRPKREHQRHQILYRFSPVGIVPRFRRDEHGRARRWMPGQVTTKSDHDPTPTSWDSALWPATRGIRQRDIPTRWEVDAWPLLRWLPTGCVPARLLRYWARYWDHPTDRNQLGEGHYRRGAWVQDWPQTRVIALRWHAYALRHNPPRILIVGGGRSCEVCGATLSDAPRYAAHLREAHPTRGPVRVTTLLGAEYVKRDGCERAYGPLTLYNVHRPTLPYGAIVRAARGLPLLGPPDDVIGGEQWTDSPMPTGFHVEVVLDESDEIRELLPTAAHEALHAIAGRVTYGGAGGVPGARPRRIPRGGSRCACRGIGRAALLMGYAGRGRVPAPRPAPTTSRRAPTPTARNGTNLKAGTVNEHLRALALRTLRLMAEAIDRGDLERAAKYQRVAIEIYAKMRQAEPS